MGFVVWGWAIVGMLVETYGFWLLFAGFVPTALSFLRRLPILGRMLDLPLFKTVNMGNLMLIWIILAMYECKAVHCLPSFLVCCHNLQWECLTGTVLVRRS